MSTCHNVQVGTLETWAIRSLGTSIRGGNELPGMGVLGTELRSSGRATVAFNYEAVFYPLLKVCWDVGYSFFCLCVFNLHYNNNYSKVIIMVKKTLSFFLI